MFRGFTAVPQYRNFHTKNSSEYLLDLYLSLLHLHQCTHVSTNWDDFSMFTVELIFYIPVSLGLSLQVTIEDQPPLSYNGVNFSGLFALFLICLRVILLILSSVLRFSAGICLFQIFCFKIVFAFLKLPRNFLF